MTLRLTREQVSFLRDLKGAPASILLALGLSGASLTRSELELATGYSDKPVGRGLALLELHGFVQNNGRAQGWSLRSEAQTPLFPAALLGGGAIALGVGESRSVSESEAEAEVRRNSDFLSDSEGAGEPGEGEEEEVGGGSRRISVLEDESRRISVFLSSSASSDPDLDSSKGEEEESGSGSRRISGFGGEAVDKSPGSVEAWLLRAGIGRRSPKMRQLLGMGLAAEYVAAWVLEMEWWQQERKRHPGEAIGGRRQFSVGTLIRILLDGDVSPPKRCESCLQLRPCYCDVVVR